MVGTIAGSLIFDTKTDTSGFEKGLKNIDSKTGKMTNSFNKLSGMIVAAFSINVLKNFGTALIETTAELQAMDAQFDQVFKGAENQKALDEINKKSEELGIHADRLKKSFSSFGSQVKGAGMDAQKGMEATSKATSLAADAAAFYDMSLENASASLASFLKGNFEAGDALKVFTNAKQMSIRANEMYGKSWDKLTEAERQWLLLDTVQKTFELNGAVGQASRESDNWATVTGNLSATWDRFLEAVGAPILEGVVVMVQSLTEVLGGLVSVMQKDPEITETFINILLGFLGGLVTYLAVKNVAKLITELNGAITIFGKALPSGRVMFLSASIFTLIQLMMRLSDVWGDMSGSEQLISALGAITIAATSAFIAMGAFQSAMSMGVAAGLIIAGIVAMTATIRSAESRVKATAANRSNSYGNYQTQTVPRLATGAVIPPNGEFLAVLGDQKYGTNIEAPLSTIEQAVDNVLARRGGTGNGGTPIILELDGHELARATAPYNTGESSRRGVRLIKGLT